MIVPPQKNSDAPGPPPRERERERERERVIVSQDPSPPHAINLYVRE